MCILTRTFRETPCTHPLDKTKLIYLGRKGSCPLRKTAKRAGTAASDSKSDSASIF